MLIEDFGDWGIVGVEYFEETDLLVVRDGLYIFQDDGLGTVSEVNETLVTHEDAWTLIITLFSDDFLQVFSFDEDVLETPLSFECDRNHVVLTDACERLLVDVLVTCEGDVIDVPVEVTRFDVVELEVRVNGEVYDLVH